MADAEARKTKLNAEIANGRLAMMAIIGMFFQDGLTGSAWGDWELYTASPLRAFENERGVQDPVGFWDPVGFTAEGNAEDFARRRQTELKHGRVSMLATMGYITPEITGKLPGYLSPSTGLKFADVPNGLAAISKVPAAGWAQIGAYGAFCELSQDQSPGTAAAAGDFGFKVLTSSDPAEKTKKLAAEIANGRLAMMAIMGMFFQDGLTGSAWGDWSLYTASPLRAFENELGVQAPVGFWDPMGLAKDGDAEAFKRRRVTEIKHGRVCMIACLGYIVPEYVKFPGYLSPSMGLKFEEVPNGLAALSKVPAAGMFQWLCFCGVLETSLLKYDPTREPGNFENAGVLGVPNRGGSMPEGEGRTRKLNAELANGRLAMMAIIGMFYQDGLTGQAWGDWELYTDSPLRAFEGELGVQPPVGFWDPLGFSADGDAQQFRRRRSVELKHGRVSMIACMGYITPEYYRWEGELSPSQGIKFADVPNGLAALSKVPAIGWVQTFLFIAFVEGKFGFNDYKTGTPGVYGWKVLTSSSPEGKQKKLAAEIANGRLAMMAIIGMFYQDGLTGSAWGDWSLYTDSPLRSGIKSPGWNPLPDFDVPPNGFEGNVGDQPPLGFWDPLGYTADGDFNKFQRRREVEIKHGRVSMLACIGYIVPEYFRWPGMLSPSEGISFTDVPNGLGALAKVPVAGWAQIFAFAGAVELGLFKPTGEPGNYGQGFLGA